MMNPSRVRRRTALHTWHAAHGADFVDRDGWLIPTAHPGQEPATGAPIGLELADVSAVVKIAFQGRGVPAFARLLVGDGPACQPRGVSNVSLVGPAQACRLTEGQLLLLTSTTDWSAVERHLALLGQEQPLTQIDVTSAYAVFWLMGPALQEVLPRLTALNTRPTALPVGACAETGLAGVPALLVPSADFGRPGMRICIGWDVAEYVWERLLEEGRPWNITPRGWTL